MQRAVRPIHINQLVSIAVATLRSPRRRKLRSTLD